MHKKGNTGDVQNYRPISQINVRSKFAEILMKWRNLDFVSSSGIISENQFGFRVGHGTSDAVI